MIFPCNNIYWSFHANLQEVESSKGLVERKLNIEDYEVGEIIHQPLGVVFQWKSSKGGKKNFLFRTDDIERYTKSHLSSILLCINNCQKNENEDIMEICKIILWYMEIRNVLLQTMKILPRFWRFIIDHKGGECKVYICCETTNLS